MYCWGLQMKFSSSSRSAIFQVYFSCTRCLSICTVLSNKHIEKKEHSFGRRLPRRRHCRRTPPDDMFFSASISAKLRELAKMRTSTRLMRRCRKVTEASNARPWEGSMFSSSCCRYTGDYTAEIKFISNPDIITK